MTILDWIAGVLNLDSRLAAAWVCVGFLGQTMFFGRFFVQWIASERAGDSVIPVAFWWFSIGGGAILLAYAVHKQDPVFIFGQAMGLLIYLRNLMLIARRGRTSGDGPDPSR